MKKYFLVVLLSSFLMCNVNAFTNELEITKSNYYVCDNDIKYPIYNIKQNNFNYYFLNMNNSYNFDFRDYYQIETENIGINERVRAFTSYKSTFLSKPNFDEIYNPFVTLMIYRYLNNNDDLYLCDKDLNHIVYHSSYEDEYQRIKDIIDGPNFYNPIRLLPNQEYSLEDNNLSYYSYEGPSELGFSMPNSKTIIISGDKGTYNILFKYYINGTLGDLYYDGVNYLLKEGVPKQEDFAYTVEIDDPILYINNYTEENIDLSNICFKIRNNNVEENFCTNNEGVASVRVPIGIYDLDILSDINNDYSHNQIAIYNVEHIISINWGENVTPNEDNNVDFIPNDTLELSGLLIALVTMLGVSFAIKKIR